MSIIKKLFARGRGGDEAFSEPLSAPEAFDPQSPDFIQNPYPHLQQLRREAPVLRLRNGSWVLSRHSDIVAALADPRLGNSPSPFAVVNGRNREKYTCADVANHTLPFLDAPAHGGLRQAMAQLFLEQMTTGRVSLTPLVDHRLQTQGGGCFDLLEDFATPLCVQMMLQLFGISSRDPAVEGQLKSWSSWFFYLFSIIPDEETLAQLNAELDAFRRFMGDHLWGGRASRDGLCAAMARLPEQYPEITEQQVIDNCLLLMADGVNADFGVANAMLTLAQQPAHFRQLQAQPELCGAAAAELLRFNPPSLFIARRALEDLEIGGQCIRRNSGVLLMLASGNRDETVFSQPDKLDFSRRHNPYLTFGKGAHACLGRVLVLNLVKAVLQTLVAVADGVELQGGEPRWESRAGHRWLVGARGRVIPRHSG